MHGFDVATAAQSAAFFIRKSKGSIDYLKLVKLMYLSEREFMKRYDEPLFYDVYINMDHGPAPSYVMKFINGELEDRKWSEFVSKRTDTIVQGRKNGARLDRLSEAELGVLDKLWLKFKTYSGYQIAAWTHDHCREWQDPKGKPRSLSHQTVFRALKKGNAMKLASDVEQHRELQKALSGA